MNSEGFFKCAFGICKYQIYIINNHVKIQYITYTASILPQLREMIDNLNLKIMDELYPNSYNNGVHFVVTTDEFNIFQRNVINNEHCWVVDNADNEKRIIDGRWYSDDMSFAEFVEEYIPCTPPPPAYNALAYNAPYNARNAPPPYNERNAHSVGGKKGRKTLKYHPTKYYKGIKNKTRRKREIEKYGSLSWKNPKAYVGFKTDKGITTKQSTYTTAWKKIFPDALSLESKSKASGVPLKYIMESYNRGMAAWRTGHRPGATEQQWGYARVHSFLLCGKTYHTTDSDLVRKAKKDSKTAKKWWETQC